MAIPILKTIPVSAAVVCLTLLVVLTSSANADYHSNQNNNNNNNTANNVVPTTRKLWRNPKVLRNSFRMSWRARQFMDAHNRVRLSHHEPPLQWSKPLARYARQFAKQRVHDCKLLHSKGKYGENIFWGSNYDKYSPSYIVQAWADEEQYYDAAHNTCAKDQMCKHYTQLVWLDTTKVGCASVRCHDGGIYAICNYDPPGNYVGESPFVRHV